MHQKIKFGIGAILIVAILTTGFVFYRQFQARQILENFVDLPAEKTLVRDYNLKLGKCENSKNNFVIYDSVSSFYFVATNRYLAKHPNNCFVFKAIDPDSYYALGQNPTVALTKIGDKHFDSETGRLERDFIAGVWKENRANLEYLKREPDSVADLDLATKLAQDTADYHKIISPFYNKKMKIVQEIGDRSFTIPTIVFIKDTEIVDIYDTRSLRSEKNIDYINSYYNFLDQYVQK